MDQARERFSERFPDEFVALGLRPENVLSVRELPDGWSLVTTEGRKLRVSRAIVSASPNPAPPPQDAKPDSAPTASPPPIPPPLPPEQPEAGADKPRPVKRRSRRAPAQMPTSSDGDSI